MGIYLKLLKIGSVYIVSNVKFSPKAAQETSGEFPVEFRLLESELSVFAVTWSFL